jgi:hypothetical protein
MCTRARPYGRVGRCGFGGRGVTVGEEDQEGQGPAVEPTEADDEVEVEEPTDGAPETEDGASGAGSSGEAATAAMVYLRGPARLPQPPLPQNRPVILPQGRM